MKKVYRHIEQIAGPVVMLKAEGVAYGELARIRLKDGNETYAQVIKLRDDEVTLQVFAGSKGVSTGPSRRAKPTVMAMRNSPSGASRSCKSWACADSAAATMAAQPAWKRSPAAVRLSLRVERCSSVTPMSCSSARICWLTADVLVRSSRAAAAKLPWRTTAASTPMRLS